MENKYSITINEDIANLEQRYLAIKDKISQEESEELSKQLEDLREELKNQWLNNRENRSIER